MMKITSIRIKRNSKLNDQLLGVASIQLDDCLIIHGIKLLQLKNKRVVSFPNKKIRKYDVVNDGNYEEKYEYTDIVHPSNVEFRNYIEEELFKYFDMGGEANNE